MLEMKILINPLTPIGLSEYSARKIEVPMGISTWKANTRAKNKNYMRSKRTDMTGLPNKVFLKVQ